MFFGLAISSFLANSSTMRVVPNRGDFFKMSWLAIFRESNNLAEIAACSSDGLKVTLGLLNNKYNFAYESKK